MHLEPIVRKPGDGNRVEPLPGRVLDRPVAPAVEVVVRLAVAVVPGDGALAMDLSSEAELNQTFFKEHVVLLRRLANPYLPPNDPLAPTYNPSLPPNTYITVDQMDYVPAFDAVSPVGTVGGWVSSTPPPGSWPHNVLPSWRSTIRSVCRTVLPLPSPV